MDYAALAVRLKQQMNDIIDVAYKNWSEKRRRQFKRFTIHCTDKELKSRNGDCRCFLDGHSEIRIVKMGIASYRAVLLTTMHEVCHHIEHSLYGDTGHDEEFYQIHLELLFAAFDMGILSKDDVINSGSTSRSLNRVIIKKHMLDSYVPHPVEYKQDAAQVFVYNAYAVKDRLKARGYKWNSLDAAWVLETNESVVDDERDFLLQNGLKEDDIKVIRSSAVVVRLRKNVQVYGVPYEQNQVVKELGYRWNGDGKKKYWWKKIEGNSLPEEERAALDSIAGIRIVIS